tara:strand:+ start:105 stop:785 length:681 start_codon:yes stop_codon:yes gene_type:complete
MSKKPNVKPLIKPGLFLTFKGKAKDYKGMKDLKIGKKTGPGFSGKKRIGGIMKYSSGMSPESAKATAFAKDKLEKLDKGVYETGSKIKGRLAAGIAKVKAATTKLKDFAKSKFTPKAATKVGEATKTASKAIGTGTGKALVTANRARVFKALRFARAATPIGAATLVATSIKKRDPKAVKAEREFFKGKKYEDYGFESMQDYAKPKKKNKGGMVVGKGADYIKDLI